MSILLLIYFSQETLAQIDLLIELRIFKAFYHIQ